MKNVSSLAANINNSPKTPGGISKSLLTPCRRVGLSRNWKKKGPSPFISPLASTSEENNEKTGAREKTRDFNKDCESPVSSNIDILTNDTDVDVTPSRNIVLSRKRKSKTLISDIRNTENSIKSEKISSSTENEDKIAINSDCELKVVENESTKVSTPLRQKSKSKINKHLTEGKLSSQDSEISSAKICDSNAKDCEENADIDIKSNTKEKSPNELKKECIVVIQRKIFKDESKNCQEPLQTVTEKLNKVISQTLFDSDSDDLPLCQVSKTGSQKDIKTECEDDDFIKHKSKIRKLETTKKEKPKTDIKKNKKDHDNTRNVERKIADSFDDDEDFDFDNKRTILIRKSYEKIAKPSKAKSTGSITQRDIDELKARIEVKKKVLLAKTLTDDTKELRDLIKKWQKGCQDALMQLMDLMKTKFSDKSNMDYSEILQSLHIPATLVGYDAENDCFITPDDTSIVLGQIKDL